LTRITPIGASQRDARPHFSEVKSQGVNCGRAAVEANQKQVGSHDELASDVFARVVPRSNQVTSLPKRNNRCLIFWLEWSNFHERVEPSDGQKLSYAGEKRNLKLPAPTDVGSSAVSGVMG